MKPKSQKEEQRGMMDGLTSSVSFIYFSDNQSGLDVMDSHGEIVILPHVSSHEDFLRGLDTISNDYVVLVDKERMTSDDLRSFLRKVHGSLTKSSFLIYQTGKAQKLLLGSISNLWNANPDIMNSPVLIARKSDLLKVYGGADLAGSSLSSIGYSVQKLGGIKYCPYEGNIADAKKTEYSRWKLWRNYMWCLPGKYLFSGKFFKQLFEPSHWAQRDMVYRMLMLLFACFVFVFMPYISKDYGVSGDEFVDHRHAGYVLDYFAKGDKTALNQPQTALHLYGNSVQVITAAVCRWFDVENYYELRHWVGGLIGAVGVMAVGLMGLRWGGGLCGLLSMLLIFFTPRFFGHAMNNLKDAPFAVGYMLALFYMVRLFDYFPVFRLRHILGLVLGIALALGTRSGGLILYPMIFMYAGLYYINLVGIKNFYKFRKYSSVLGNILQILMIVVVGSFILSIALWPFALVNPLHNVLYSLTKFTNYSIGLRTIFDGEQMMSNMLPWQYAPKYLLIGMPVVVLIGFLAYGLLAIFKKNEFSLIAFTLLFATIFPVFWVIYQHSNLYGGIRHLLFVMLPMVVIAGYFWSRIIDCVKGVVKMFLVTVFVLLLSLPCVHAIRNHPNEYVYFNEFKGGLKAAYGDYETDYYFNSLKESADWFRAYVLPTLPKDKKTVIVTQALEQLKYYFRRDTNIQVIYSRYYEKYSKDWDYAIFGNVYINKEQLMNHLFPIEGTLYTPLVDGFPMSFVAERKDKRDLEGFMFEKQKRYTEALAMFETYLKEHPANEEVWSRAGKLYYLTNQFDKAQKALDCALLLHPSLNEALYIKAMLNIDRKDYQQALQAVAKMLSENKFSADGWYLKALVFYKMGNHQESINSLNRLFAFRPNFDRAHVLAGDILRDNGDYRRAMQFYETALRYNRSANTYVKIADIQIRLKEYEKADMILKQLLEQQPTWYPSYKVKCRQYIQEQKWQDALACLMKMEDVSNDAELFLLRALYWQGCGDEMTARKMLQQSLSLEPNNKEALNLQAKWNGK